jgi:TrmH family RNA methyltransferase
MISKSEAKYIQSLGHKKSRDEEGLFIAEGPKLVHELIVSGHARIKHIYALADWIGENKNLANDYPVTEISADELKKISQMTTPNQVLTVIQKFEWSGPVDGKGKITLALDTIQDPGNLGTIIRTADWFAVEQVVCSLDCADLYNPKVVQATMGSIARVRVFYTDLSVWLAQQSKNRVYATAPEGQEINRLNKINEGIIVIGNESIGIREEILKLANVKITIPKIGKAESLNAAVAAGVVLSWIRRAEP